MDNQQKLLWQGIIDRYDQDVRELSCAKLQTKLQAKKWAALKPFDQEFSAKDTAIGYLAKKQAEEQKTYADFQITIPYVEGIYDAVCEALIWFRLPPPELRIGLLELTAGRTPSNLFDILRQYGDYRANSAVLMAYDLDHVAFSHYHKAGKDNLNEHRQYAASFLTARIRYHKQDLEAARKEFATHVYDIINHNLEPPHELGWNNRNEFKTFLAAKQPLTKIGKDPRFKAKLHKNFHEGLTEDQLLIWADDTMIEYFRTHYLSYPPLNSP